MPLYLLTIIFLKQKNGYRYDSHFFLVKLTA